MFKPFGDRHGTDITADIRVKLHGRDIKSVNNLKKKEESPTTNSLLVLDMDICEWTIFEFIIKMQTFWSQRSFFRHTVLHWTQFTRPTFETEMLHSNGEALCTQRMSRIFAHEYLTQLPVQSLAQEHDCYSVYFELQLNHSKIFSLNCHWYFRQNRNARHFDGST